MWKKILALGLVSMLLLSGCGPSMGEDNRTGQSSAAGNAGGQQNAGNDSDEKAMGRYVESEINLPEGVEYVRDIRLGDNCLEFIAWDGTLYRLEDQEQSWQLVSQAPEELQYPLSVDIMNCFQYNGAGDIMAGYIQFLEDEEGNTDYNSYTHVYALFLADGTRIPVEISEQEYISSAVCDETGTFYLSGRERIYRVNGQDGSLEVLTEFGDRCDYLTICGKYLMIQGDKLQIYDMEENKMADQDPVLEDFLKPWLGQYGDINSRPYLMWMSSPEEKSLYVLTRKGLYSHVLYGSTVEQLIDGSLCSISDLGHSFVNMLQLGEAFYVLYSGQLKQYVYDPTVPTMPENILRVWGLQSDEDIQRVVGAFAQSHPDLYVTYEHPLSEDTGMTREDAMKVLSTELATGNGPDVLLLDDLPYDTYVEKGVLADLTETLDGTGERYMDAVRESYRRDTPQGRGQYAMPMSLTVPVLMGEKNKIQNVSNLEQLADLMEQSRAAQPEGTLLGFNRAENALELLAIGSTGDWMNESGGIDSEGVKNFLTQARRIYNAEISGLTAKEIEGMEQLQSYINGVPQVWTQAGYQVQNAMYFHQPFALGMLNSSMSVMGDYSMTAVVMSMQNMVMVPMSGENGFIGQASNILAVNEASKVKEQALEFVAYALSKQFCSENYMRAGSTNWDVLEEQIRKNEEDGISAFMSFEDIDGKPQLIEVENPSEEELAALRQILEACQGVSQCDSRVYDAVIEVGAYALTDKLTIDEAVKEIEKKVSLYLAE
ncbi:MAG: extracellular solute-binding protein [Lachnospiraceae bacterium]|nr:extracellular solute-binding protein [Lachnospiraceae bacterium]